MDEDYPVPARQHGRFFTVCHRNVRWPPAWSAITGYSACKGRLLLRPLEGIRVLDLSRMIAGGVAGMLLADFGADVVKVEQPGSGDPLRQWTTDGEPLWWRVYGRNKRHVTLNLKSDTGRDLLRRLLPRFDVVMESFVPGTLERLELGWEQLQVWNPRLILVRISGWGQTGPSAARPGFGTLVEAASGFAAMNGEPGRAPIVPSFPLADMTSALYATNAVMFALYDRDAHGRAGQAIDVSLFESLFSLLGPLAAEYDAVGRPRERSGSRSRNAGPRGCYRTADDRWIAVSGSTPKMAERFLQSYGLGDLLADQRFATNEARVQNAEALDEAIAVAIAARTLAENLEIIDRHALTAVAVQTIADIEQDPHWRARGLLVPVQNGADTVRMHDVVPRLLGTPGEVRWVGGRLGEHNHEFYAAELGLERDEIVRLEEVGVI
jgi:crotonobetainyl-CoA:carnitine CoA-transferase CaiB-like acyl-CoA transferase